MKAKPVHPTKLMLAMDFADGTAFVGETSQPARYLRALLSGWKSGERPKVRVVSSFVDIVSYDGRGYDIEAKYIARCRAVQAGKKIRATDLGADGRPVVYESPMSIFRPEIIAEASKERWGGGEPLHIAGLTFTQPAPTMLHVTGPLAVGIAALAAGAIVVGMVAASRDRTEPPSPGVA